MAHEKADRTSSAHIILGDSARYLQVLDALRGSSRGQYRFLDPSAYQQMLFQQPVEAIRVYWKEVLYRAHIGASISLLRLRDWVEGALVALERRKYLTCIAGMRGLLESVADSEDSLR